MPNKIYQKIQIFDWKRTNEFKEAKSKVLNSENNFDFNLLIPQPDNIFNENLGEQERKMCIDENRPLYEWNMENWGTKGNAYNTKILENDNSILEFKFKTSWNMPIPIINALFKLFKNCEIHYLAVDEGGYFAYEITQDEKGEITKKNLIEHCDTILFALS